MRTFDLDTWQEVWTTVRRNRLRAALTAFGVFWGVFMLLGMLGFGNGLERGVNRQFGGSATNSVHVWARTTTLPWQGTRPGRPIVLRTGDVAALKEEVEGIDVVAPRLGLGGHRGTATVRAGAEVGQFSVMGDSPDYRRVQPMVIDAGRFLDELDLSERRKVAVVGKVVQDELFEGRDPIGRWVAVGGVWFKVVGTFHGTAPGDEGERVSSTIHVPFTTFQQVFHAGDAIHWLSITGAPEVSASDLEDRVREALRRRHRIHPDDDPAIRSWNTEREFGRVRALFDGIEAFVWVVGTATLLSGVVGVSNILLISVRERTSEIGLRRALGATPGAVVRMIVLEAVVLTTLAGYAGVVAGVGAIELAGWFVGEGTGALGRPDVQVSAALGAAGLLAVSGLLAGALPAQRAVSIQPVDALRTE